MLENLNLVFMGTPAFAVPPLRALHEAGHNIVAVYTQPPRPAGRGQKDTPSPVHRYAQAYGLPVYTPTALKTPEAQAEFASHKADVAVVAAYGLLLSKPILGAYPLGCVNVHPSLLPRWRGAAPIQRSIMAGDKETGVCIMQMDEGLDTGGVLLEERIHVPSDMNAGTLHDLLAERSAPLLLKALEGVKMGTLHPRPQPEEGVTYAKKITKEECRIDWRQPADTIRNQVRGLSPQPGAYFLFKREPVKVLEIALPLQGRGLGGGQHTNAPGAVLDNMLTIACGGGALHPLLVQRPGKKPMATEEMLRGFPIPTGTVLE